VVISRTTFSFSTEGPKEEKKGQDLEAAGSYVGVGNEKNQRKAKGKGKESREGLYLWWDRHDGGDCRGHRNGMIQKGRSILFRLGRASQGDGNKEETWNSVVNLCDHGRETELLRKSGGETNPEGS